MPTERRKPDEEHHNGISLGGIAATVAVGVIGGALGFLAGIFLKSEQEEAEAQAAAGAQAQASSQPHLNANETAERENWQKAYENLQKKVDECDGYECVICFETRRNVIFGCEHLVTCEACAKKLELCPICRAKITSRRRVNLYN